ncbi:MAG: TatD family hydrolase [Deltaproteobacteria bacterium]|nr:TatD family hydrolase [Deltaproteobacteria bacterium]
MLIDSHAHLDLKDFQKDLDEVLERAIQEGLSHIITIGIDLESSRKALKLAHQYEFIFSSIGFHPHDADKMDADQLNQLSRMASDPKVVGWGEIGLDFFKNFSPREKQVDAFNQQLDLAVEHDLPVIIHNRDAHQETYETLRKRKDKGARGVIHCFSGDYDLAMRFMDMGYYISIPGTVTYSKASNIQDVAARIPLERMLVETDAPFLAPVPKRGKRNEPAFVIHTAKKIAELRGMDFEEVARQTSENTRKLFGI